MLDAQCHCGDVKLHAGNKPSTITRCNCSICHRLGALWGYFDAADVTLQADENRMNAYSWGEKSITYYSCNRCACTTHYRTIGDDGSPIVALNCRMAAPEDIEAIPVRRFDGRVGWRYLDDPQIQGTPPK